MNSKTPYYRDKDGNIVYYVGGGDGDQAKYWLIINGVTYLLKADTEDKYTVDEDGRYKIVRERDCESIREITASEILINSGIDAVEYRPYESPLFKGRKCSICKSFLDVGERSINVYQMMLRHGTAGAKSIVLSPDDNVKINRIDFTPKEIFDDLISIIVNATNMEESNVREYMLTMVSVDAIIANVDRHLKNIEFIRDANGVYRGSPLFDFGKAFARVRKGIDSFEEISNKISQYRTKPFSVDPIENAIDKEFLKAKAKKVYETVMSNKNVLADELYCKLVKHITMSIMNK